MIRATAYSILLVLLLPIYVYSQEVEISGGYPVKLVNRASAGNVQNWNNGSSGVNVTVYTYPLAIQVGAGYVSNNYKIGKGIVHHNYINVPVMLYPKLYADGSNIVSIGVGVNFFLPLNKTIRATVNNQMATEGIFKRMVMPKIAIKYTRVLNKTFLFFAEAYSEITVMESFFSYSPGHGPNPAIEIPHYYSPATIGANVGIGYILPVKNDMPKYFQKWQKKQ